jgi:hypothetical protein
MPSALKMPRQSSELSQALTPVLTADVAQRADLRIACVLVDGARLLAVPVVLHDRRVLLGEQLVSVARSRREDRGRVGGRVLGSRRSVSIGVLVRVPRTEAPLTRLHAWVNRRL